MFQEYLYIVFYRNTCKFFTPRQEENSYRYMSENYWFYNYIERLYLTIKKKIKFYCKLIRDVYSYTLPM